MKSLSPEKTKGFSRTFKEFTIAQKRMLIKSKANFKKAERFIINIFKLCRICKYNKKHPFIDGANIVYLHEDYLYIYRKSATYQLTTMNGGLPFEVKIRITKESLKLKYEYWLDSQHIYKNLEEQPFAKVENVQLNDFNFVYFYLGTLNSVLKSFSEE